MRGQPARSGGRIGISVVGFGGLGSGDLALCAGGLRGGHPVRCRSSGWETPSRGRVARHLVRATAHREGEALLRARRCTAPWFGFKIWSPRDYRWIRHRAAAVRAPFSSAVSDFSRRARQWVARFARAARQWYRRVAGQQERNVDAQLDGSFAQRHIGRAKPCCALDDVQLDGSVFESGFRSTIAGLSCCRAGRIVWAWAVARGVASGRPSLPGAHRYQVDLRTAPGPWHHMDVSTDAVTHGYAEHAQHICKGRFQLRYR